MSFPDLLSRFGSGGNRGASSSLSNRAKKAWKSSKKTANKAWKSKPMSGVRSMAKSITSAANTRAILESAVGDSAIGRAAVGTIFDGIDKLRRPEPIPEPIPEPEPQNDNGDIVEKLEQIDQDIIGLDDSIKQSGRSVSSTVTTTTHNQTQQLTGGTSIMPVANSSDVAENMVDDIDREAEKKKSDTMVKDIGSIKKSIDKMIKMSEQSDKKDDGIIKRIKNFFGNDDGDDGGRRRGRDDGGRRRGQRGGAGRNGRNGGITRTGNNPERPKTIRERGRGTFESIRDKIKGRGANPAGKMGPTKPSPKLSGVKGLIERAKNAPASMKNIMGNLGNSRAATAGRAGLSAIGNIGRGAAATIGGIGTGTAAAATAALIFGGTGLNAAYKFAKGEDASTWLSDAVDSGYTKLTGSKGSMGTDLYDSLHDEQGRNKIAKFFGMSDPDNDAFKSGKIDLGKERMVNKIISETPKGENPIIDKMKASPLPTPLVSAAPSQVAQAKPSTDFIASPEPDPIINRIESEKMEQEKRDKESKAPVVIQQPPTPVQPQKLSPGIGGGQEMAPIVTRPFDNTIKRITDRMLLSSI